jgi:hypothetical protein
MRANYYGLIVVRQRLTLKTGAFLSAMFDLAPLGPAANAVDAVNQT